MRPTANSSASRRGRRTPGPDIHRAGEPDYRWIWTKRPFLYPQIFGGAGEVANRVLLEAGTASGREPTTTVELRSYLGEFLEAQGISLGAEDEKAFPLRLLHFRRTFVEKMFAIHSKVEIFRRDGRTLGTYARHYYDLFQLAAQPEVMSC